MKALLLLGAALLIPALALSTPEPVIAHDEAGGVAPTTCSKYDVVNPCSGCAQTGVMDKECKPAPTSALREWKECNVGLPTTCSNGTQCDNETGVGGC